MIEFLERKLVTVQGRLTTGIALVGALLIGFWPDHPRPFSIEKAVTIAAAAVAWLFAELADAGGSVSQHDIDLFNRIRETYGEQERHLLGTQDFGHSFVNSRMNGIFEISHWIGAAHEFVDSRLQDKWEKARRAAEEFSGMVAQMTAPAAGNPALSTVHPIQGDSDDPEQWVWDNIKKLNNSATGLSRLLDEFERYARRRLRL